MGESHTCTVFKPKAAWEQRIYYRLKGNIFVEALRQNVIGATLQRDKEHNLPFCYLAKEEVKAEIEFLYQGRDSKEGLARRDCWKPLNGNCSCLLYRINLQEQNSTQED